MKREIAEKYGEPYARLAELLNEARGWAKGTLPTYQDRKEFFEWIVNGDPDPVELLRAGDEQAVRDLIAAAQRTATSGIAELSHLDDEGRARMVDVGGKDVTDRRAVARGGRADVAGDRARDPRAATRRRATCSARRGSPASRPRSAPPS